MHAYKTLPPLERIAPPRGDPRAMRPGSLERAEWFDEARAFLPEFNPSLAIPARLEKGSVAWHLWCEWDYQQEAIEELVDRHSQDGIADQACQEPGRWDPVLQLVPEIPLRTIKRTRNRTRGEIAALDWVQQMR